MTKTWSVVNLDTGETYTERYETAQNVIRYGLTKSKYEPGQYDIYPADENGIRTGEPVRAYKWALPENYLPTKPYDDH